MAGLNSTMTSLSLSDPRTSLPGVTPMSTTTSSFISSSTSSSSFSSTPSSSTTTSSSSTSSSSTPIEVSTTITSIITTPSVPPTVVVLTQVTTISPSVVTPQSTTTSTRTSSSIALTTSDSSTATSTSSPSLVPPTSNTANSSGLSPGGTIAVAVVVPVVVVALLLLLGIFAWRKRKQRRNNQEERRKEVEEYGYNPNNDPTLPAVGAIGSDSPDMAEDSAHGYRGWGNVTNASAFSNRKASTTLSGSGIGMAFSEDGRHRSPNSPPQNPTVDGQSGDPLVEGAAGGVAADAVAHHSGNGSAGGEAPGVHRGPSNASSTYSAAGRTDNSEDMLSQQQDFGYGGNNYTQYTAYHPGAGGYGDAQPVIRDVSARRNTKIENPTVYPQPGNSGIAQNF